MLSSFISTSKVVGAVSFVGVALILVYAAFFKKDQLVPDELRGCYQSAQGQVSIVKRSSVVLVGSSRQEIAVKFEKTNLWDQLSPTQGVVPQAEPDSMIMLVPGNPGNVIRISSSALTFFMGDGRDAVFGRVRCKERA